MSSDPGGADAPGTVTVPGNRWDLAPPSPGPASVTVVVTHYEQPDQLARTLAALRDQRHPANLVQVVVADDGSAAPPVLPPGVEMVTHPDRGFRVARIRNLAARVARHEVLVFLDADTTPEPDYLARITRLPGTLPEAVVVGRRRHADLAGVPPGADVRFAGLARVLDEPAWLRQAYRDSRDLLDADEMSFRFVIGAVSACSRWLFEQTGGFDETIESYGGEDWEWAHRAWTRGAVLAHEPLAVAWHDGPDRASRPGWGADRTGRERMLRETLAVASRVPVPGVSPRGLLGAAPDPLVTVAADVEGDRLVITLDDLLAAWPRARVLLDPRRQALLLGDPRVVCEEPSDGAGPWWTSQTARGSWRRLHLHRALRGSPSSWTVGADLLIGPGAPGRVEVRGADGRPAMTWSTLRAECRAARWRRDDLDGRTSVAGDLSGLPDDLTVQAHWGGWS